MRTEHARLMMEAIADDLYVASWRSKGQWLSEVRAEGTDDVLGRGEAGLQDRAELEALRAWKRSS